MLADAAAREELAVDIVGLICNEPDAGVIERANSRGVRAAIICHRDFDSRVSFDAAVVDALVSWHAEWVIMAGWMRIVTPTLLNAFDDRVINIHPSLLPAFRGVNAVEQALEAGVKITGCTVHIVREEVDDGPILGQAAVEVLPGDDAASLHARIHEAEHRLYPVAISHAVARNR